MNQEEKKVFVLGTEIELPGKRNEGETDKEYREYIKNYCMNTFPKLERDNFTTKESYESYLVEYHFMMILTAETLYNEAEKYYQEDDKKEKWYKKLGKRIKDRVSTYSINDGEEDQEEVESILSAISDDELLESNKDESKQLEKTKEEIEEEDLAFSDTKKKKHNFFKFFKNRSKKEKELEEITDEELMEEKKPNRFTSFFKKIFSKKKEEVESPIVNSDEIEESYNEEPTLKVQAPEKPKNPKYRLMVETNTKNISELVHLSEHLIKKLNIQAEAIKKLQEENTVLKKQVWNLIPENQVQMLNQKNVITQYAYEEALKENEMREFDRRLLNADLDFNSFEYSKGSLDVTPNVPYVKVMRNR